MKNESLAVEVLQPPLPAAALMAKPIGAPQPDGLAKEVADLRELVTRLGNRVEQLERITVGLVTVCCRCGLADCQAYPHVPIRYWQRFGPSSWEYFRRDDMDAASRAERAWYEMRQRGRGGRFYEDRMLDYGPASYYERGPW